MGRIFGNVSLWYRLKCWSTDTILQIIALPSYVWPKPLKSTPLTEEEHALAEKLLAEEDNLDEL